VSEQDEALRLADAMDNTLVCGLRGRQAAAELRRLHAEVETLRETGIGYSQQTIDAVVREREKLREANEELLEALRGMVALEEQNLRGGDDDDISIELRRARAAIAKATEMKP
jgi:hypothetical protein